MMLNIRNCGAIALACLLAACADDDGESDAVDNRVEIPPEDANHINFIGGEVVIEPGEDKTFCFHLPNDEDMALRDVEMLQGDWGHHAVVVSTTDPKPPGTIEDCTEQQLVDKYTPLINPSANEPPGYALWLGQDMPIVLQSHYVNAGDEPIRIRDVVRAERVPVETVETWMSPFVTVGLDLDIPGDGKLVERSFDCTVSESMELMYIGGHMHEQGKSFEFHVGTSEEDMEMLYKVDEWIPEFRDLPPVEIFDRPMTLDAGTILRTTCRWENKTGVDMEFPGEMCVAFGVIAGSKETYDCRNYGG